MWQLQWYIHVVHTQDLHVTHVHMAVLQELVESILLRGCPSLSFHGATTLSWDLKPQADNKEESTLQEEGIEKDKACGIGVQ